MINEKCVFRVFYFGTFGTFLFFWMFLFFGQVGWHGVRVGFFSFWCFCVLGVIVRIMGGWMDKSLLVNILNGVVACVVMGG